MNKNIKIKLPRRDESDPLTHLLMETALIYSKKDMQNGQKAMNLRKEFISMFKGLFLDDSKITNQLRHILTVPIYKSSIPTLLEQIANVMYRYCIEEKDQLAELKLTRGRLDKINHSPKEILDHLKEMTVSFPVLDIQNEYTKNFDLILRFNLKYE